MALARNSGTCPVRCKPNAGGSSVACFFVTRGVNRGSTIDAKHIDIYGSDFAVSSERNSNKSERLWRGRR
jgi:hypothetical protein